MLARRSVPPLSAIHRRWILIHAIALTGVVNLILNGGIAWLSAIGTTRVPLWAAPILGGPSTITDTIGTLFLLPLITNLLITTAVRRELRNARLTPLHRTPGTGSILRRLHNRSARGFALAAGSLAALGPPAIAILITTNFGDIPTSAFVLYKAILGITLGAIVTPVIAVHAMADAPPSTGATRRPRREQSGGLPLRAGDAVATSRTDASEQLGQLHATSTRLTGRPSGRMPGKSPPAATGPVRRLIKFETTCRFAAPLRPQRAASVPQPLATPPRPGSETASASLTAQLGTVRPRQWDARRTAKAGLVFKRALGMP